MKEEKKAVALKYQHGRDRAPKVVAKGKKWLAEKIIQVAKENKIPLYSDRDLVEVLEKLDLDAEIPPQLYQAVAEVFVFIYRMNKKFQRSSEI